MNKFRQSLRELKSTRVLATVAMLIAMQLALKLTVSIQVTESLRISFDYLAHVMISALFGPTVGALSGAITDLLGFLIKPTGPYFPGFTLSAMLNGVIYGLFFYRARPHWLRIVLAQLVIALFVNSGLNTLWINMLYGKAFWVILPARLVKNLLQYLADEALLFGMMYLLMPRAKKLLGIRK